MIYKYDVNFEKIERTGNLKKKNYVIFFQHFFE